MSRTLLVLVTLLSILAAACGPTATRRPHRALPAPRPRRDGASPGESAATGWDPAAVTGTAVLSGWRSSPEEGEALTQALLGFPAQYPNIKIDYQPIAGRLPRP